MYELRFDGKVRKFKSLRELVVFMKRLTVRCELTYCGVPLDAVDQAVVELYNSML